MLKVLIFTILNLKEGQEENVGIRFKFHLPLKVLMERERAEVLRKFNLVQEKCTEPERLLVIAE